jgi:hypothetical protein
MEQKGQCLFAVLQQDLSESMLELSVISFTGEQADLISHRIKEGHFQDKTKKGVDEVTWQRVRSRITLVPKSVYPDIF